MKSCNGQWLSCACEVLQRNGVEEGYFAGRVYDLLEKGCGKYRNIMIIGAANWGKTFLLNPLNVIYNTFSNPACTSFAWVGAEKAEVLFLNDFRWFSSVIQWHDFLLLLEGQLVHFPAPKSHYEKRHRFHWRYTNFCDRKESHCLCKEQFVGRERDRNDECALENILELPVCGKCFATLSLGEEGE